MKRELRDGLVLRSLSEGVESDYTGIAQFYLDVFGDEGDEDSVLLGQWVEDLISDKHPVMTLDDIWVVADPAQDERIVSALMLIPMVWHYDHIALTVGRPEIIATHKDYRRRGLVRALMDVAHERSLALGHIAQGITGIGHYYRRFGYAMAINLGAEAQLPLSSVRTLKPDQTPKFTLRPATTDDIDAILAWDTYEHRDGGIRLQYDWKYWEYTINHRSPNTPHSVNVQIIVDADGNDVGYISVFLDRYYREINIWQWVVGEQSSFFDTFHEVLREVKAIADEFYEPLPDDKYPTKIRFDSGLNHALKALARMTDGGVLRERLYTWYIRVADVPAFIQKISPVLEKRLAGSGMNRFTGELKISFYQLSGIKLTFEDGKIKDVTNIELGQHDNDVAFPYHSFLSVLFGHRSRREIAYILPETYGNQKAEMLLDILFPKMHSQLIDGIG